jgi:hypothetical protein
MKSVAFLCLILALATAVQGSPSETLIRGLSAAQKLRSRVLDSHASDGKKVTGYNYKHVWNPRSAMLHNASDMTVTTVGDFIYLVGGCNAKQMWNAAGCGGGGCYECGSLTKKTMKYSVKENTFTYIGDAPRARFRHAAVAVGKKIYVFGGRAVDDSLVDEVDVLDTENGKWYSLTTKMTTPVSDNAGYEMDGKIYSVGGYSVYYGTAYQSVFEMDPAATTNTWTEKHKMVLGRGDLGCAKMNSEVVCFGGFSPVNQWKKPYKTLEIFSKSTGKWALSPVNMTIERGDKAGAAICYKNTESKADDLCRLHIIGGETKDIKGNSVPVTDVETFDPVAKEITVGGDIPNERFRFNAAVHGGSIFVFGGQGYLVGGKKAAGSYYPVVNTVMQYQETRTTVFGAGSTNAPSLNMFVVVSIFVAYLTAQINH